MRHTNLLLKTPETNYVPKGIPEGMHRLYIDHARGDDHNQTERIRNLERYHPGRVLVSRTRQEESSHADVGKPRAEAL